MGEMRECELAQVCLKITDGAHKSPPTVDAGFPMASVKDMEYNRINLNTCRKISEADYYELVRNDCKPKLNDVLIAKDGSYLKNVFDVEKEEDVVLLSSIAIIRPDTKKIIPKYLKYMFSNPSFQDVVEGNFVSGAVIPRIVLKDFKTIQIAYPPLPEQKVIASVLSSLDDKIDLLHRQNKTLEAMAETLFRQWFVESDNSTYYTFKDLVSSISVKHSFANETIIFLNTSDIYDGYVLNHEYSEVKGLPGQAKKSIQKGDILFTEIRPANRRFAFIDFDADDYVVSTKLMVLRSKRILSRSILFFYLKQQETLDWLQMLAEARSGTFPQITFDDFKALEIYVPPKNKLTELTSVFDNILEKTFKSQTQIRTLEKLRDTLLPKLMSGEVRVEYEN